MFYLLGYTLKCIKNENLDWMNCFQFLVKKSIMYVFFFSLKSHIIIIIIIIKFNHLSCMHFVICIL
jgi:hypothetical protein